MSDLLSRLELLCSYLTTMEERVDAHLEILRQHVQTFKLNEAMASLEDFLTIESQKSQSIKFSIAGATLLRCLIDDDAPTFSKVDQATIKLYRKRLLHHYHPDRETADVNAFNLVQKHSALNNLEFLAILVAKIGLTLEQDDLDRLYASALVKSEKFKQANSFKLYQMHMTGKPIQDQVTRLQSLIDERAKRIYLHILRQPVKDREDEAET